MMLSHEDQQEERPKLKTETLIISDIHLGSEVARPKAVKRSLKAMTSED